jgi:hypothetical protein
MPFFEDTVKNCFVRFAVNDDNYRVGQVEDVKRVPKVYDLGGTKTNKVLVVRCGGETKDLKMTYLSNGYFKDSEFANWARTMNQARLKLPTVQLMEEKKEQFAKYTIHFRKSFFQSVPHSITADDPPA